MEWVYAPDSEPEPEESDESGEHDENLVVPPLADAEHLYTLGMSGNVIELCKELERMERTDERYGPLARKLRRLTRTFQMAEIRTCLEKYVGDRL